jgi:hypothetical protein
MVKKRKMIVGGYFFEFWDISIDDKGGACKEG